MSYKIALDKAWVRLNEIIGEEKRTKVKLLADEYDIDIVKRQILSLACNVPPHDHIAIIILHYLIQKLKGLPKATGEWISFKDLPGGQGYFDAFKKRALNPVMRKYGENPQALNRCLDRLPGKKIQYGDVGIALEAFREVPVLVTIWGKDEEFSAEANILFDRSIKEIFCTEDVAVLSDIISRNI